MFKIESYITPILLSYVDKYIKDFRPEYFQVSLWGGDACFHNLDLRLEVLEEELQLPFSILSGHIHELLFHVPWTKLASEPITVTINTIECILKLRSDDQSSDDGAHASRVHSVPKEKKRRRSSPKQDMVAPPGYVQTLINKIVNNITIYCNNLILKYVEEDIVLSVNIKTVKVQSANENWEPAFTEMTPSHCMLRKLITLSDLTICLDKMNSSGKIEMYQEPLLYRCVMEMHLLQIFHSIKSKSAAVTRIDLRCFRMDFSLTEQQIPMLIRLFMLAVALQKHELQKEKPTTVETIVEDDVDPSNESEEEKDEIQDDTWTEWAWSWMPNLISAGDDNLNPDSQHSYNHILHFGIYVDLASISFKVTESTVERSYYGPRKVKFVPFLVMQTNGAFVDAVICSPSWSNFQLGVSYLSLEPCGDCFCGVKEMQADCKSEDFPYLSAGNDQENYLLESLFDPNAVENKKQKRKYNFSWDYHITSVTETLMLERSPALGFDLVYLLEIPDDITSERLSEVENDLENSNLSEHSLMRLVVGPFDVRIRSGLFHRLTMVQCAANAYDYDPYCPPKPEPSSESLHPVSMDDFEALESNIPIQTFQLTIFKPTIKLYQSDHQVFDVAILQNNRKRRKSSRVQPLLRCGALPSVSVSCQCLDAKVVRPMYPQRLVGTVCQLPDPPGHMFDACHLQVNLKVLGMISQLQSGSYKQTILLPSSISFSQSTIIYPALWKDSDLLHEDRSLRTETITAVLTKPQFVILLNIFQSLSDVRKSSELLLNTSLLSDAFCTPGTEFLEINLDSMSMRMILSKDTIASSLEVGAVKAFVLERVQDKSKHKQVQCLVLSGPDPSPNEATHTTCTISEQLPRKTQVPLLTFTAQAPLSPDRQQHPPVLSFSVQPVSICIDPLLWRWILYAPRMQHLPSSCAPEVCSSAIGVHAVSISRRIRKTSEASSSHRSPNPRESVHSSSDREPAPMHIEASSPSPEPEESVNKETEKIDKDAWNPRGLLLYWFPVWRGLVISGDIAQCTIYLPTQSLSAVGTSSIEDALSKSVHGSSSPDILVICFPFMAFRSATQRQSLNQYSFNRLPLQLPENVWMQNKVSFPWSMSWNDISIYTIQKGKNLYFLKPCSVTATIGISTKNQAQNTLTSLGLCVHVDASPIILAASEEQVSLMMNVFLNLSDVQTTFASMQTQNKEEGIHLAAVEPSTPVPTPTSPTIFRESTPSQESPAIKLPETENSSEKGVPISFGSETVKVTVWMQCTLARLSVNLYALKVKSQPFHPDLKLSWDMEDIMTSFDIQQVYLKAKLKVASANIQHYKRYRQAEQPQVDSIQWIPGPYLGIVMQAHEENGEGSPSPPLHPPNHHYLPHRECDETSASASAANGSFLTMTFTRASCGNVHSRWGTPQGANDNKKSCRSAPKRSQAGPSLNRQPLRKPSSSLTSAAVAASANVNSTRYINEIVAKVQPMDFVISPSTLGAFLVIFQPVIQDSGGKKPKSPPVVNNATTDSFSISANALPLMYLDTQAIRVIIPASELMEMGDIHNVCMLQFDTISLSPQVENPLSRVLVRPDIYHWAEQAGFLRIPGSGVEDRQYQLDISGMSLSTGTWRELERVLARPTASVVGPVGHSTGLRTMSENPALEWNQLQGQESIVPHVSLLPILSRADLSVVVAPAIVLEDNTLVCGHSLEVNALKDIEISASTRQILIAAALSIETLDLLEPLKQICACPPASEPAAVSDQFCSFCGYYSCSKKHNLTGDSKIGIPADSGVDSIDVSSASNLPDDSVNETCCNRVAGSSNPPNAHLINESAMKTENTGDDKRLPRSSLKPFKSSLSSSTFPVRSCEGNNLAGTAYKNVKKMSSVSQEVVPVEILFTSGSWSCLIYEVVDKYSDISGSLLSHFAEKQIQKKEPCCGKRVCACVEKLPSKSQEEENSKKQSRPLIFLRLVQPHTFVCYQALTCKIQMSCFDVSLRTGFEQISAKEIPTVEDFESLLLETRGGDPHPGTGIPPSFLTIRWSRTLSKPPKLDVNFGRPSKIHISLSRINHLISVKEKLLKCSEDIKVLSLRKSKCLRKNQVISEQTVSPTKQDKLNDFQNSILDNYVNADSSDHVGEPVKSDMDRIVEKEIVIENNAKHAHEDTTSTDVPIDLLSGLSSITLSTEQIIIAISSEIKDESAELLLGLSKINASVTAHATGSKGIPERISIQGSAHCLTITTKINGSSHLLLNPWSFRTDGSIAWEEWHPNSPLVTLTVDSDCIFIDVGPDHLRCLLIMLAEYSPLRCYFQEDPPTTFSEFDVDATLSSSSSSSSSSTVTAAACPSRDSADNDVDQQYSDDLRAGAFQFVDAVSGSMSGRREEIPLPYQVVFTASPPSMTWRYPQPRALTRVEILPVPFKVAKTSQETVTNETETVLCELQCRSEVHLRWLRVVQFELSENESRRLQLRSPIPGSVGPAARVWRVRLAAHRDVDDGSQTDTSDSPSITVCPRTLAACMRVDSFFSAALVPQVQVALELAKLDISFQNHFGSVNTSRPMPSPLTHFTCDGLLPDKQTFAVASVGNISSSMALWKSGKYSVDMGGMPRLDIIDYAYLTQHCVMEPFRLQVQASVTSSEFSSMELSVVTQPISLRFGPALAHTLAVSLQMWNDSLPALAEPFGMTSADLATEPQVLITRYVICNDTNRAVRFGQVSTDEDLLLSSRQCHLYSWRSQKAKRLLRVSADDSIWAWSDPFNIDEVGVHVRSLNLSDVDDVLSIVVKICELSSTQKQITIFGQLIISNILSETFECKILSETEGAVRQPQYVIADGNSTSPSLLLSTSHNALLRIRFKGLNSLWTGDIPLKESSASGQPWLVKVPLMERGQFLSVWCRVFHERVDGGTRVLAMLCPLYMIRSFLPVPVKVSIDTPGLKVTMQTTLAGRGERQQLYCPGTIDHSHRLKLQLEQGALPSNPYVPLSYSMIDEQAFFKTTLNDVNVDVIAEHPSGHDDLVWPFVDAGVSQHEWRNSEEQPQTYVQVAYKPLGPYCASLLVELRPWALFVNTLGIEVAVRAEERIVCSVLSPGVAMPPRLETTFHLLIPCLNDQHNFLFVSGSLQLARNDWEHRAFYMPHIAGLIPQDGRITVTAYGPENIVCLANINSRVIDDMRILHIQPHFVFANAVCSKNVHVALLAVQKDEKNISFTSQLENIKPIIIPAAVAPFNLEEIEGTAMIHWTVITQTQSSEIEKQMLEDKDFVFYVVISIGHGWSCPLYVGGNSPSRMQFAIPCNASDNNLISESYVLTFEEKDDQVLLTLHPEQHPQIVIYNKCNFKLVCAQGTFESSGQAVQETEHLNWWCIIPEMRQAHYHLPGIARNFLSAQRDTSQALLVFALVQQNLEDSLVWSYGIDINEPQERFLYLPGHGDVRVSVRVFCHTAYISVETVSHVEISARDIRARLLGHKADAESASIKTDSQLNEGNTVTVDNCKDIITWETSPISASKSNISASSYSSSSSNLSPSKENILNGECTVTNIEPKKSKKMMRLEHEFKEFVSHLKPYQKVQSSGSCSVMKCFIKGFHFTLLEDLPRGGLGRTEVIALNLDDVCISLEPGNIGKKHESQMVQIFVGDLQIDNQMFQRGGFDFPVILMGQPTQTGKLRALNKCFSLSAPAQRLIEQSAKHALLQVRIKMVQPRYGLIDVATATHLGIVIGPLNAYIEDTIIIYLMESLRCFSPGALVMASEGPVTHKSAESRRGLAVRVLSDALFRAQEIALPLRLHSLAIEPLSVLLSVHTSVKLYIALEEAPLQFAAFERKQLITTPYRLGHALTMHYLSGALFGLGWVVGSLELLGAPGGLARELGLGIRDFFTLPYQGIFHGPWAFLMGISHGSASLMRHITAGTLTSVTKLASSVARNLDRLTLDQEHLARAEEQRRHRPHGLTEGLMQGLAGFGISILGAVGGIAHHPIQLVMNNGPSPGGLVVSVGRGLVGVVTKPLSGAAELVARTGEGLLYGAGWASLPEVRHIPVIEHIVSGVNSNVKYSWKLVGSGTLGKESILFITEATAISQSGTYEAVALVLCTNALFLVNLEDDTTKRVLPLTETSSFDHPTDPTLICLEIFTPNAPSPDITSHDRVLDFVRRTAGFVHGVAYDTQNDQILSLQEPYSTSEATEGPLTFFVNPQSRSYFLSLFSLVKRQCEGKGFTVL